VANRYARRVDDNHREIVAGLRDIPTIKVKDTSHYGDGFPDFLARVEGDPVLYMFEVKAGDDKHGLTNAEIDFILFLYGATGCKYRIIRNIDDALCSMEIDRDE